MIREQTNYVTVISNFRLSKQLRKMIQWFSYYNSCKPLQLTAHDDAAIKKIRSYIVKVYLYYCSDCTIAILLSLMTYCWRSLISVDSDLIFLGLISPTPPSQQINKIGVWFYPQQRKSRVSWLHCHDYKKRPVTLNLDNPASLLSNYSAIMQLHLWVSFAKMSTITPLVYIVS